MRSGVRAQPAKRMPDAILIPYELLRVSLFICLTLSYLYIHMYRHLYIYIYSILFVSFRFCFYFIFYFMLGITVVLCIIGVHEKWYCRLPLDPVYLSPSSGSSLGDLTPRVCSVYTNPRCPPTDTNGYLCQRRGQPVIIHSPIQTTC